MKIILLNLVAIIAAGAMLWFLQGELTAGREAGDELAVLEGQVGSLAENKGLLGQAKADINNIRAYFVSDETLPDLIETLETMATNAGVDLSLTQAVVEEGGIKLRLELSATGSFAQVTNYLARLEALPYELIFNNVRLNQTVDEKSSVWRLQTSLIIFSYHDEN